MIFVTFEYLHSLILGLYSLPYNADICPLLKLLGEPVHVCNLYILDMTSHVSDWNGVYIVRHEIKIILSSFITLTVFHKKGNEEV